jgi:hypothetical protein
MVAGQLRSTVAAEAIKDAPLVSEWAFIDELIGDQPAMWHARNLT